MGIIAELEKMKWLPSEEITYQTTSSLAEVTDRLSKNIIPYRRMRFRLFPEDADKLYEGEIEAESFEIKRIIRYNNSFLPIITGSIETQGGKTVITVKMELRSLIKKFSLFYLTGLVLLQISFLTSRFELLILSFIPLSLIAFNYLLTHLAFKYESRRSVRELAGILEATLTLNASEPAAVNDTNNQQ
jgi:hypothetical protein